MEQVDLAKPLGTLVPGQLFQDVVFEVREGKELRFRLLSQTNERTLISVSYEGREVTRAEFALMDLSYRERFKKSWTDALGVDKDGYLSEPQSEEDAMADAVGQPEKLFDPDRITNEACNSLMRFQYGDLASNILTLEQICSLNSVDPVMVNPVLQSGEFCMLVGRGGVGKTYLALNAGIDYVRMMEKASVLYYDTEHRHLQNSRRFRAMMEAYPEESKRFRYYKSAGEFVHTTDTVCRNIENLRAGGIKSLLIIFDSSTRVASSINNQYSVDFLFNTMERFVSHYGALDEDPIHLDFLLLHHVSKGEKDGVGSQTPTGNSAWLDRSTYVVNVSDVVRSTMVSDEGKPIGEEFKEIFIAKSNNQEPMSKAQRTARAGDKPRFSNLKSGARFFQTGKWVDVEYIDCEEYQDILIESQKLKSNTSEAQSEQKEQAKEEKEQAKREEENKWKLTVLSLLENRREFMTRGEIEKELGVSDQKLKPLLGRMASENEIVSVRGSGYQVPQFQAQGELNDN